MRVLVIGATGSIGREVVEHALAKGHSVRAVVRRTSNTRNLDPRAELFVAEISKPETLTEAVEGIDAVIFTHGVPGPTPQTSELVNYGAVLNILDALKGRQVAIALMTAIGVTTRNSSYNRTSQSGEWKLRSERLVRASGNRYTIVRPGWFDYNASGENSLWLAQGDTRANLNPAEIGISRKQIAQVLVESLTSPAANGKTFELYNKTGAAESDLEPLFAQLQSDNPSDPDGPLDKAGMPASDEPIRVLEALERVKGYKH